MTSTINKELCFRCCACSSICPKDSIDITEFNVEICVECDECGVCERICPVGAIFVKKG